MESKPVEMQRIKVISVSQSQAKTSRKPDAPKANPGGVPETNSRLVKLSGMSPYSVGLGPGQQEGPGNQGSRIDADSRVLTMC